MKIVIVTEWFSEKMGYIENCLPKALATLGHEVHIITSNLNVYYNIPDFEKVYGSFLGRPVTECFEKKIDGYMLHRLPHGFIFGKVYIKGLTQKLKQLSPDVVQVFDYSSLTTYQVLMVRMQKFFAFFTANHMVASVFPLFYKNNQLDVKWRLIRLLLFLYRYTFGKLLNAFTEKLHAPTRDAGEIAKRFFGVSSEKIRLTVLGVDTDYFKPLKEEQKDLRKELRMQFGFLQEDIVCIYTGRFTEDKNPLVLAQAIEQLQSKGENYKGIFLGSGPQYNKIKKCLGCMVLDFIPYTMLAKYYQIADIGVWPRQESTSMLDASACGLPIIISNRVLAEERKEGNGMTYTENDADDLVLILLALKDQQIRRKLGEAGTQKILQKYSWNILAQERSNDYYNAIKLRR